MVVPVAAALTAPRPGVAPKPVAASMQQVRAKQQAQVSAGQKQALVQQQRAKKSVDNFGENSQMSPALESWCKEQMRKLNGSDDLTLVRLLFCIPI
jgi:transcription initiation factor TFIID subunit TAF12